MNSKTRNNLVIIFSIASLLGAFLRVQIESTLASNFIGSFLVGILGASDLKKKQQIFFCSGFCASLTTFSSWLFSVYQYIIDGYLIKAFVLLFTTIIWSLGFVCFGFFIGLKIKHLKT